MEGKKTKQTPPQKTKKKNLQPIEKKIIKTPIKPPLKNPLKLFKKKNVNPTW